MCASLSIRVEIPLASYVRYDAILKRLALTVGCSSTGFCFLGLACRADFDGRTAAQPQQCVCFVSHPRVCLVRCCTADCVRASGRLYPTTRKV